MANETAIDELFMKFAGIYFNRWTSNFKANGSVAVATKEWQRKLAGLTDQEIDAGYLYAMELEQFKTWPPTANEFRDICVALRKSKAVFLPRLPYKRSDEQLAKGKAYFKELKQTFDY